MRDSLLVLDADLHTFEPDDLWARYLDSRFRCRAPPVHRAESAPSHGPKPRHAHYRLASAAGYDPPSHLQAMDIEGIDVGILYGTRGRHVQMYDDLEPELADALARAHNDWTYDFCARDSRRLRFAAQIAYHDVDLAVREVERAVEKLGAVAVIGNPNPVNGRHIHDPANEPLWQALTRLNVPMCFHPTGVWTLRDDVGRRFLGHPGARMIGNAARNPIELMLAFASLVAGGVFDRHPTLACGLIEGTCGWIPWWLWRLDDSWEKFPMDDDVGIRQRPSEYFRRHCFVTTDADEKYLEGVIAAIGDDRIVFSSDYPHCDSLFPEAVSRLIDRPDISAESKRRILWDNGSRLYPRVTAPAGAPCG
jgi:uncharacterized protein